MNIGQNEIWRVIDGYLNYEVSSHGRVRNNKTGKIMKPDISSVYHRVTLYEKTKSRKCVHKLVGEAFIDNPNKYDIVDHIDRNATNNNYENLRWVNQSLNEKNKGLFKNNKCGHAGVRCDRGHWRASWTENGIKKTKNCNSMEDAIEYRKEMEQLHGYIQG
jgi:hypothetical protein